MSLSNESVVENRERWRALHKDMSRQPTRTRLTYVMTRLRDTAADLAAGGRFVRAIELGCGFGRNIKYVLDNDLCEQIYGIEQTDEALEQSRLLLKSHIDTGRCVLRQMDAGAGLDFPDGVFDLAFDIMSPITFIPTGAARDAYFRTVSRILKPGGVYFFLTSRAEGRFNDAVPCGNAGEDGLFRRDFDGMIEKRYREAELIACLGDMDRIELSVVSDHTRAFGEEKFRREDGFWLGTFRKR